MREERSDDIEAGITLDGDMANLPDLLRYVEKSASRHGVDDETAFAIRLATEEVCTNIIRHGYAEGRRGTISLTFEPGRDKVAVSIVDEAPHFDPAESPKPDTESPWEERPIGGLGWHLVYQLVDEVRHEPRQPSGNRVVLVKHLSSP